MDLFFRWWRGTVLQWMAVGVCLVAVLYVSYSTVLSKPRALGLRRQGVYHTTLSEPYTGQSPPTLGRVLFSLVHHLSKPYSPHCLCMHHLNHDVALQFQICGVRTEKDVLPILNPEIVSTPVVLLPQDNVCGRSVPQGTSCYLQWSPACQNQRNLVSVVRINTVLIEYTPPQESHQRHWLRLRGSAAACIQLAIEEIQGTCKLPVPTGSQ